MGLAGANDGYFNQEECAEITYIDVFSYGIQTLCGIEFFTALTELNCRDTQLTELDVSGNTALIVFRCSNNQLTQLDLSSNTELIELYCEDNQLTELNLINNMDLELLYCSGNHLAELLTNSYYGLWEVQVSPQTITLPLIKNGDVWTADLSERIPRDNLTRIDSVSQGSFNVNTGIVTFDTKPDSFIYDCYIGKVNATMQVEVELLEEENTHKVTVNDTADQYPAGEQVAITADPFYTSNGWGYRFAGWSGDTDTVADAVSSSTTLTVPERDIILQAEYILIGDIDGNGDITPSDAVQIARMSVQNIPEMSAGDIDGDGIVTSADVVYMKRYLVGNFVPSK